MATWGNYPLPTRTPMRINAGGLATSVADIFSGKTESENALRQSQTEGRNLQNELLQQQIGESDTVSETNQLDLETAQIGKENADLLLKKKKKLQEMSDLYQAVMPADATEIIDVLRGFSGMSEEKRNKTIQKMVDPQTGRVDPDKLKEFKYWTGVWSGNLLDPNKLQQQIKLKQSGMQPKDFRTNEQKLIEYRNSLKPGKDRSTIDGILAKKASASGMSLTWDDSGNPVLRTGGAAGMGGPGSVMPPTKKTVNQIQGELLSNTKVMFQMQQVGDTFNEQFLTVGGRLKNLGLTALDYAGALPDEGDATEWYQQRTDFEHTTERLFNAYRKYITGAAASYQELERLRKSFLNTKLPPKKFKAAYNSYLTEIQRLQQVLNRVVREGFQPTDKNIKNPDSKYNQRVNALFTGKQGDDRNIRGPELDKLFKQQVAQREDEGPDEYQDRIDSFVRQQLRTEGYFNSKI